MQTQTFTYNLDTSPLKNGFFQFGGGQEISGGNSKGEIDYYPFGMLLPNRNGSEDDYRYGFNGMEDDEEMTNANGQSYDFGARFYNPRVGRFFSLDPMMADYPFMSPYCYAANNPVRFVDKKGNGPGDPPLLYLTTTNEIFESWLKTVNDKYAENINYTISAQYNESVDENGVVVEWFGYIEVKDLDGNVVFAHAPKDLVSESTEGNTNTVINGIGSASAEGAYTLIKSDLVRTEYIDKVKGLAPTDGQGRSNAKMDARAKTPAITKTVAENMRPSNNETSRTSGTANKTNAAVNDKMGAFRKTGYVLGGLTLGTAGYDIATAENKTKAVTQNVTGIAGAVMGGEVGATIGASIGAFFGGAGAIPGALIGGLIGSIWGGIVGYDAGGEIYEGIEGAVTEDADPPSSD